MKKLQGKGRKGPWNRDRWLIGKLRELTLIYPGRGECFKTSESKVVEKGRNDRGRLIKHKYYPCKACGEWFRPQELEVDHIEEIGPFTGDWNSYLERMFCPSSNLQLLCIKCHAEKTSKFVKGLRDREIWREL